MKLATGPKSTDDLEDHGSHNNRRPKISEGMKLRRRTKTIMGYNDRGPKGLGNHNEDETKINRVAKINGETKVARGTNLDRRTSHDSRTKTNSGNDVPRGIEMTAGPKYSWEPWFS